MKLQLAEINDLKYVNDLYNSVKNTPYCVWDEYYPTLIDIECDFTAKTLYLIKEDDNGFWWDDCMFDELISDKLNIRIKYFEGATKLKKIAKGNWIDVYANKDMFVKEGDRAMIPLGFALELPTGWEGHLAPRSSTFKTWGIIQTNSVGVVDDTYIGDNDQWHMPVYCLQGKDSVDGQLGTIIRKGDKIGQFRIMEVMPQIEFEEVDSFGNADRGMCGTTGTR